MHLIEVDVIGLHPPQAVFARLADVERGKLAVVRRRAARVVDLRRDHDALTPPITLREPTAHDGLGQFAAVAVDVGGVEEVQPELETAIDDAERLVLVGLHATPLGPHAEVHGAETQWAHAESGTSKKSIVHVWQRTCEVVNK